MSHNAPLISWRFIVTLSDLGFCWRKTLARIFPSHDRVKRCAVKPRVSSKYKTRYPLGLTVICCLHLPKRSDKAKSWLLYRGSTLCFNVSQKGLKSWISQDLSLISHIKLTYRGWHKHFSAFKITLMPGAMKTGRKNVCEWRSRGGGLQTSRKKVSSSQQPKF